MTPSTLRGLALLAVASLTLACPSPRAKRTTRQPPAEPTTAWEQPSSSEADRTRRMEDQARDINQRWSETQQNSRGGAGTGRQGTRRPGASRETAAAQPRRPRRTRLRHHHPE